MLYRSEIFGVDDVENLVECEKSLGDYTYMADSEGRSEVGAGVNDREGERKDDK